MHDESAAGLVHASVTRQDAILEMDSFSLWHGDTRALHEISMPLPQGKITALVGPSGCGKSILLRSVNRLNDLADQVRTAGDIRLAGHSIYAPGVDIIALRKKMGMVFRKPNPFPMSIYENVVYAPRVDGENHRGVLDEACEQSLRAVALWDEVKDRLDRSALKLSDGEQQRLCIARAIAAEPELLLMDEPCSALDPIATAKIEELIQILSGDYTILIVTHNMRQASRASDFTAFMHLGGMIEYAPTGDLFTKPRLRSTADYLTGRFG